MFSNLKTLKEIPLSNSGPCALSYAAAPPAGYSEHPLTLQLREQTTPQDCNILNILIGKISECPASKKLWENATAKGPINLFLAPKSIVPSRGFWEYNYRNLAVERTLQPLDNKLSSLIFELCNAKSPNPDFIEDLKAGKLSSKQFLRKMFFKEDGTLKCQHQVAQACKKSNQWNSKIDLNPLYIDSEAEKQKRFDSSHPNYIKANMATWNQYGRTPYCNKNPQAPDCLKSDL